MTKYNDIFKQVTDQIVANLEHADNWRKPWGNIATGDAPHNAVTGHIYTGFNWLLLSTSEYASPQWLTYKQAKAKGGNVRKGERGTQITYFKMMRKEDKQGNESVFPMLKVYTVFNIEQTKNVTGIKEPVIPTVPEGGANAIADALGVDLQYGGDRACFIPQYDIVKMPVAESFKDRANHDATLLHELTHWTGHKSRLGRLKALSKGDTGYAFEELIAELGSAMLGSILGLPYDGLQHDSYIASWLKVLKSDPKHIYTASKHAKKAVEYIIEHALEQGVDIAEVA